MLTQQLRAADARLKSSTLELATCSQAVRAHFESRDIAFCFSHFKLPCALPHISLQRLVYRSMKSRHVPASIGPEVRGLFTVLGACVYGADCVWATHFFPVCHRQDTSVVLPDCIAAMSTTHSPRVSVYHRTFLVFSRRDFECTCMPSILVAARVHYCSVYLYVALILCYIVCGSRALAHIIIIVLCVVIICCVPIS